MQGRGAGAYGHGLRGPDVLLEVLLEARDSRPRAYPARPERRHDLIDLLLLDKRTPEHQEILPHRALSCSGFRSCCHQMIPVTSSLSSSSVVDGDKVGETTQ